MNDDTRLLTSPSSEFESNEINLTIFLLREGVGRRSSRQAKHRIVGQVMTITASSDDSRSNGDEFHNGDAHASIPDDGESCTGEGSLVQRAKPVNARVFRCD